MPALPAISGITEVLETITGIPKFIASIIGKPKPSSNDTKQSAFEKL